MKKPTHGGGLHAIRYTWNMGKKAGFRKLWTAMNSRNACKTCALGMGGQAGGMRNELGHWPEVCKKSLQAMVADMQGRIEARFFENYGIEQLKALSPRELESAGRLTQPLRLQANGHYAPIDWEAAMELWAEKLRATDPEQCFFYMSGRASNEAGFLTQLLGRQFGTNHVNNCSFYCHQASGVGLTGSLGVGTGMVDLTDIEHCDLFVLIGGNPASNHPRLLTQLMKLRQRGGRVIVVNPVVETGLVKFRVPSNPRSLLFGTEIASDYIQVHTGGDIAWLSGVAKALLELPGGLDQRFVAERTRGWEEVEAQLRAHDWRRLEAESGVDEASMRASASHYAKAEKVIFAWTMGITHHLHAVENVQWIANLALMRGMVGRPHAGLMPIRGHSNVQGIGTIGVTPELKAGIFQRFVAHGIAVPAHKGYDTMACMDAAYEGRMRVGTCLGGNLYGSNPDSRYADAALAKLELLVHLNTSLNTGHAHGAAKETLILPVLARDEEPHTSTQESMFSYVRLSDGGPARHAGPRSEIAIMADLGRRLLGDGGPIPWSQMGDVESIREWIAKLIPGLEQIREIGTTKKEFTIPDRILHGGPFPTEDGRARFFAHPLPQRKVGPQGLTLQTTRSEGQFNSVVYEDYDFYRGQDRRNVILMNVDDILRLGLVPNQWVEVRSEVGSMSRIIVRPYEIRAGNALMYYPEANILVPRALDPRSRTPSFKAVAIEVHPDPTAQSLTAGEPHREEWEAFLERKRNQPQLKSC